MNIDLDLVVTITLAILATKIITHLYYVGRSFLFGGSKILSNSFSSQALVKK